MIEQQYSTSDITTKAMEKEVAVTILVNDSHPLLQLKRALDWDAITAVMSKWWEKSGKNIDGGPGCRWPVSLYALILVLKIVKGYGNREMEAYLAENGVARAFISVESELMPQIRDHSNIHRAEVALGPEGLAEVNNLIVKDACRLGFADRSILSSDTTVQEARIGYPNEPGILKGVAERTIRALKKLQARGMAGVDTIIKKATTVIKLAKHHHLFAKEEEEKESILSQMVEETREMLAGGQQLVEKIRSSRDQVTQGAIRTLDKMKEVTTVLLPQIVQWMTTGVVAKGKIIHAGIPELRAIVRNKAGKKVEFGCRYLINRLAGGYLFVQSLLTSDKEVDMPLYALTYYREIFGPDEKPDLFCYDRGGSAEQTVKKLIEAGVKNIGIQPKGKAKWHVAEEVQKVVLSQRGQTEGSIGTLKSKRYGFNKPLERSLETMKLAGQRSVLSKNLNKFMQDLPRNANKLSSINS
jgi:hypothetical protein